LGFFYLIKKKKKPKRKWRPKWNVFEGHSKKTRDLNNWHFLCLLLLFVIMLLIF
jgi:hypothetical protein